MEISSRFGLIEHRLTLANIGSVRVFLLDNTVRSPIAFCYGDLDTAQRILVRLHSRCVYGEVFHSDDCDCRAQFEAAWKMIADKGSGVFIYMDQEGRGHGTLAKAKGYAISQRSGVDSFEAYTRLGLSLDAREYGPAAKLLLAFGFSKIELMTNNPAKVDSLERHGIDVQRLQLTPPVSESAKEYLASKARIGHLLSPQFD